jgi:hypothetical protein
MSTPRTSNRKPAKREAEPKRPFKTHYASNLRIGSCKTIQGAMICAFAHVVRGEATKANVLDNNGKDVVRIHWTSFGISTYCPPSNMERPAEVVKPKLKRVA